MSCAICETLGALDPERVVLRDAHFSAYQLGDVPGYVTLVTNEHVEGPDALSDRQADRLGRVVRTLSGAIREVTDAERVHVVYLGEHARHFHLGFFPRRPDQGALLDNAPLVAELASAADASRAAQVRDEIRRSAAPVRAAAAWRIAR